MAERRDVLTRTPPPPDLTVRYGPGVDHFADVWLPAGQGDLILALHGGYWRQEHDRGYFGHLAAD
ncbi:MAG: alpha/beta hydrolase, partial [Actinocatenispora sp.]